MTGARPTLAIVQRDRPDIYEVLKVHLAAGPLADVVRVVWDRRGTEARRQRSQPVAFPDPFHPTKASSQNKCTR
jgi:hypothetical protein